MDHKLRLAADPGVLPGVLRLLSQLLRRAEDLPKLGLGELLVQSKVVLPAQRLRFGVRLRDRQLSREWVRLEARRVVVPRLGLRRPFVAAAATQCQERKEQERTGR